jgi:hypothetical protein
MLVAAFLKAGIVIDERRFEEGVMLVDVLHGEEEEKRASARCASACQALDETFDVVAVTR